MAKGDKYLELTTYLEKCGKEEFAMTFEEIEKILGFDLTASSRNHQAFWSNDESHSFGCAWLKAGYKTRHLNLSAQRIEFYKDGN